jgi:very-short-patch-repair endonuclease
MFKDIAPKGNGLAIRNARRLRREMTLPEMILWRALRSRPGGLKFRRQHTCGCYVLDFFCGDARLAIEIDGEVHSRGNRPQRDDKRDARLLSTGVATLRISAMDVLRDPEAVLRAIAAAASARLPLHHPAAPDGPPPRDKLGED